MPLFFLYSANCSVCQPLNLRQLTILWVYTKNSDLCSNLVMAENAIKQTKKQAATVHFNQHELQM